MYGRSGLDRFKKAQTLEPFSVTVNSTSHDSAQSSGKEGIQPLVPYSQSRSSQFQTINQNQSHDSQKVNGPEAGPLVGQTQQLTQVGGSQSTWQPPDWAIEPRTGVYYLEVLKDGEVIDRINLDKRRHIFGRQFHTCDFVLDHQSVSRQHAAVIPHKNGRLDVSFLDNDIVVFFFLFFFLVLSLNCFWTHNLLFEFELYSSSQVVYVLSIFL